jgi:AcrR family transcriptional regulator
MSIYNYFATRDQLLQALTGRLLDELQLPTDENAAWQVGIIGWANAMRSHFKRVPYLIELLVWEGNTSMAWLQRCLVINDVLHAAGLRNEALTQATLWVAQTVMSVIHAELFALVSMDNRTATQVDASYLPGSQLEQLKVLRDFAQSPEYYDQTFQYTLQRMVNELAQQITLAHFK